MAGVGISRRKFAELDGCSEMLVRRGIAQGRLNPLPDGTIDPGLAGSDWRPRVREAKQKAANKSANAEAGSHGRNLVEAQARKEDLLGQLRQLELDSKSGKLVDAERVRLAVFDIARVERDAWLNWPSRVAPLIAAEIGVDQIALAVTLERYVREHLADRAEPKLRLPV